MIQEESDLFRITLNEQGKKFIRKFAAISYTMLVLVIFVAVVSLYWNIKILVMDYQKYVPTFYDKIYPYFSILSATLSVISNLYYLRFPRALLRSIKINDEFGANQAFGLLFKGAVIFLFWLLLITASMIWSLMIR